MCVTRRPSVTPWWPVVRGPGPIELSISQRRRRQAVRNRTFKYTPCSPLGRSLIPHLLDGPVDPADDTACSLLLTDFNGAGWRYRWMAGVTPVASPMFSRVTNMNTSKTLATKEKDTVLHDKVRECHAENRLWLDEVDIWRKEHEEALRELAEFEQKFLHPFRTMLDRHGEELVAHDQQLEGTNTRWANISRAMMSCHTTR